MKLVIKVTAPLVALLVAAGAAVAMAAPAPPKDPYPAVKIDPNVCKVEALRVRKAQVRRDFSAKRYDRAEDGFNRGVISEDAFNAAVKDLAARDNELIDAKYAERSCQLNKGAKPKQSCEAMSLELNRLLDKLPNFQKLEDRAKKDYQKAKEARERGGSISAEQLEALDEAQRIAELDRQETEQAIQDQRDLLKADPACKDFPSERPEVLPPPREVPTSTEEPPTTTSTMEPTTTVNPTMTSSLPDLP
jgi:hypothetical protein